LQTLSGRDGGEIAVFENLWLSMAGRIRLRDRPFRLRQDTVLNILAGLDSRAKARDRGWTGDRRHQPRPRGDFPEPRAAAVAYVLGNVAYA